MQYTNAQEAPNQHTPSAGSSSHYPPFAHRRPKSNSPNLYTSRSTDPTTAPSAKSTEPTTAPVHVTNSVRVPRVLAQIGRAHV